MCDPSPVLPQEIQSSRPYVALKFVILESNCYRIFLEDGIGAAPALFLIAGNGTVDSLRHCIGEERQEVEINNQEKEKELTSHRLYKRIKRHARCKIQEEE